MYGLMAWGNASSCHLNKIKSIQDRMIKTICPYPMNKTTNNNLKQLYIFSNILPINKLFQIRYILKCYFNDQYKKLDTHLCNTRSQLHPLFKIPLPINKYGNRQLNKIVFSIFNSIPHNLQQLKSYSEIKTNVKQWIIRK
jgi:hypothetical protein